MSEDNLPTFTEPPSPFARQGAGVESVRVLSSGPLSFYTMQYGQDSPAHTGLYKQSKSYKLARKNAVR